MLGFFYAALTILPWGTWLAPAQNVPFKNQQIKTFYVAAANLALAVVIALTQDWRSLTAATFWPPFAGGLIWAAGALCAFTATARLGTARAFGIWAPLNIIVNIVWSAVLFHEFLQLSPGSLALLAGALVIILAGMLLIILPQDDQTAPPARRDLWIGVLGAVGAGVFWASYFLPNKAAQVSGWVGILPLSVGILVGSTVLAALTRQSFGLSRPSAYARASLSGVLWGVGNLGLLLLVDTLGAGKGFTLAQLSLVVNALLGIFWLKNPSPKSRAAVYILVGSVLATVGSIVLGNLH